MEATEAIKKIQQFERYGSKLGLERIEKLMELLGNPEKELKFIHIGGTNGKGSVCKYIYEALRFNNYKVGLFISPYITVFNERIEFDGCFISDEQLNDISELVFKKVDEMTSMGYESPTEFEIVTAIGFVFFKNMGADFVVLEVGLGGGGDSTNIVDPLISVITSISLDHMDRLGNDIESIAFEKAGIIKKSRPIVSNVENPIGKRVLAKEAYKKDSRFYDATKIKEKNISSDLKGTTFDLEIYGTDYSDVKISLLGEHQVKNAKAALLTLEILRKKGVIKISREKLYNGIEKASQPGRMEIICKTPLVILDGAHNEEGARALASFSKEFFINKRILMVVGILEDKDYYSIIDSFKEITDNFISTNVSNPRGMTSSKLCDIINNVGRHCVNIQDINQVCSEIMANEKKYDAIIIAGSLYLIGEVRGLLKDEYKC